MRYLTILSLTLLLGACGNKLSTLKYTGEKVSQAVNTCSEAAKNVCTEMEKVSVSGTLQAMQVEQDKASMSWDTRMMLW